MRNITDEQQTDIDGFLKSAETPVGEIANRVWYVASPFSTEDSYIQAGWVFDVRRVVAGMIVLHSHDHIIPLSPVAYTSDIQMIEGSQGKLIRPAHGWYRFCLDMMSVCGCVKVVKLAGWEESRGIQKEIAFALGKGMPVDYLDPEPYLESLKSEKLLKDVSENSMQAWSSGEPVARGGGR